MALCVCRERIQEVDVEVLDYLNNQVRGGFDYEKFGDRIGFGALKTFLEGVMIRAISLGLAVLEY